jgi:hypothetical protein
MRPKWSSCALLAPCHPPWCPACGLAPPFHGHHGHDSHYQPLSWQSPSRDFLTVCPHTVHLSSCATSPHWMDGTIQQHQTDSRWPVHSTACLLGQWFSTLLQPGQRWSGWRRTDHGTGPRTHATHRPPLSPSVLSLSLSQLSHHIMEPLPLAPACFLGISASASSVWDGSWGTC